MRDPWELWGKCRVKILDSLQPVQLVGLTFAEAASRWAVGEGTWDLALRTQVLP